ncbi:putative lysozyme [Pseudomonas phage UAVern]|uniref:Lysozyme n=1 Tax=Pseudomonas phage UAVern TaxID=2856997 RepID=A0A975UUP2_9CAUD|nr:putative lysozyme [Pseudomonas phage UAVern]
MSVKTRLAALGLSSALVLAGGALVAPWEGKENVAYKDVVGVWTQCYGDTHDVNRTRAKTDDECTDSLAKQLVEHNEEMKRYVLVPLTDYQEAAFTSLVYNIGVGNWKNSTALKLLNRGLYKEACEQLPRWNKAGGKVYRGLTNRRLSEMEVCLGNDKQVIDEARRIVELYKDSDYIDPLVGEVK